MPRDWRKRLAAWLVGDPPANAAPGPDPSEEYHTMNYFLTASLLQPLGGNYAHGRNVMLDFLVRQKVRKRFRRWDFEIGGDLCAAYDLRLKGKQYTVFLNGDAMGKSLQGAGGALVLGTAFKAQVTRTQLQPQAQDRHPEIWLEECLEEMQNLFTTFDGSMLVSVIIGLVDALSGVLYYINAEHPLPVLYRQERATFLHEEPGGIKLGLPQKLRDQVIRTTTLLPGDVVIFGSDGRDLIHCGPDQAIDPDEGRILVAVERSRGRLRDLEKTLLSYGELSDDLSLLRLAYRPENSNADTAANAGADVAELLPTLRTLLRRRDFATASRVARHASLLDPARTELLYLAARVTMRACRAGALPASEYSDAVEYAERCRLRAPTFTRNLLVLAEGLARLGHREESWAHLRRVRELEPNNPQARRQSAIPPARGEA